MRSPLWFIAILAALSLGDRVVADDEEFCADVKTCVTEEGKRCDRAKTNCPPCVREYNNKYYCYDLNLLNGCTYGLAYCAPLISSESGSGDDDTPKPTVKPTKKPTKKPSSNSDSGSDSGSGSAPAKKTPKPTTQKPTSAPATEAPTPSPTVNATASMEESTAPSSVQNSASSSSSSKMPLIIGASAAAVVVIAVVAFFIWKRNRDDDDSDDEDYKQPPKSTYNARPAAGAASVATTASYNNSDRGAGTSPRGKMGAGAYGGAQYGQQSAKPQYASGNTYAYGGYGGGGNDYGSPSTVDGSTRGMYTGRGGAAHDTLGTSERDAWGNAIGSTKKSRPVPTAANTQSVNRQQRTLSNVSVEF